MTSATTALYVRIPLSIRKRLELAANGDKTYAYRGALADTVIKVLDAGLEKLFPDVADPDAAPPAKRTSKRKRGSK